jgi:predicted HAD superfamily Cof-like phosphohydrolase
VAYGAAVTYGIDLDAALREVHRSNMSKLDDQGRPVYREDGKVLKVRALHAARYQGDPVAPAPAGLADALLTWCTG